ncbi:MAG TPA: preprotein translocase subunit SecE [Candidatus Paceibacterota bacterium]
MFSKISNYLKDVKLEMRKVDWPTRKEWIRHTIMVIVVTLVVAIILSMFDLLFTGFLRNII